jgi:hypothetical protein
LITVLGVEPDFLKKGSYGGLPFVQLWAIEILSRRPDMLGQQEAIEVANDSSGALGLRPMATIARSYKLVEWVRAQKETWNNHGPWDRRAIIWASQYYQEESASIG